MKTYPQYLEWLEAALNQAADSCSEYTRYAQESPPDEMFNRYVLLRDAWDGYNVIVAKDERYPHRVANEYKEKGYQAFLEEYVAVQYGDMFDKNLKTKLPKQLRWY